MAFRDIIVGSIVEAEMGCVSACVLCGWNDVSDTNESFGFVSLMINMIPQILVYYLSRVSAALRSVLFGLSLRFQGETSGNVSA